MVDVTQERIEHLRSEIRRCDEAIEAGGADNWWHIDRDRLRHELQELTELAQSSRHRATRPAPDGEVVAWRYERRGIVEVTTFRWANAYPDDPWTETPLFAHPPRNDAVVEALRWYGEQLCEYGPHHDGCGKYADDVCSGCKARAALAAMGERSHA